MDASMTVLPVKREMDRLSRPFDFYRRRSFLGKVSRSGAMEMRQGKVNRWTRD